jgi:hypothetical protein
MSFGKNPHVAKATAAEQKARAASDENARASAWREAARQWERAAEREQMDKRIAEYTRNAEAARREADGDADPDAEPAAPAATKPVDPTSFN